MAQQQHEIKHSRPFGLRHVIMCACGRTFVAATSARAASMYDAHVAAATKGSE